LTLIYACKPKKKKLAVIKRSMKLPAESIDAITVLVELTIFTKSSKS